VLIRAVRKRGSYFRLRVHGEDGMWFMGGPFRERLAQARGAQVERFKTDGLDSIKHSSLHVKVGCGFY
jgi:hypothetical protein